MLVFVAALIVGLVLWLLYFAWEAARSRHGRMRAMRGGRA